MVLSDECNYHSKYYKKSIDSIIRELSLTKKSLVEDAVLVSPDEIEWYLQIYQIILNKTFIPVCFI